MTQAEKIIALARAELGYTEWPKDSNRTKYGSEYGLDGQPWCVMFLWWLFRTAGLSELFCGGNRAADCGTLRRWYRQQGQTVPVSEVQPGDILILNFSGTDLAEHCGIVVELDKSLSTLWKIYTIEGNTSPGAEGSQDNGGCVALKTRYSSQIVAVCRPKWTETGDPSSVASGDTFPQGKAGTGDPSSAPSGHLPPGEGKDYEGHWAEETIRWCMERGLLTGYPDGTFRPDEPVTRAELATVTRRICEWSMQIAAEVEAQVSKWLEGVKPAFDEDRII